jgi:hypothetical protein
LWEWEKEEAFTIVFVFRNTRFGTIASFNADDGQEHDENSDEEGQAFYAGGSETRSVIIATISTLEYSQYFNHHHN